MRENKPDAQQLRALYNSAYVLGFEKWSLTNQRRCDVLVSRILSTMKTHGFHSPSGKRALDIGCAQGHITESFRSFGFESWGLDYSDVAIAKARERFRLCHFIEMDGFDPQIGRTFDVALMRGFSGCNTHDINFVRTLADKYVRILNPGGWFVLAFSSNFSGWEREGETVNWSKQEVQAICTSISARFVGIAFLQETPVLSRIKASIARLTGKNTSKRYFYLFFRT